MENIDKLNYEIEELRDIKSKINDLRKLYDKTENLDLKKALKNIIIISENIYKEVAVNSEKISKIKNFSNYYLVTIYKVLEKYNHLKENKIAGKESLELYEKIESFIPNAEKSFKKMYESLFNDDIKDIDIEIKVMLEQLNKKGRA